MAKFDWDKFLSDRRTQTAMAGIGSAALARALGLGWLPSLGIGAGVGGLYYGGTKWWDDQQKKFWDDQQKKFWDAYNDYMVNGGGARVDSALSDSGQPNEELPEYADLNKQRQEEAGTDASEAGQDIDVPYTNYNGLGLGLTQDNEALPKHLTNPDSTLQDAAQSLPAGTYPVSPEIRKALAQTAGANPAEQSRLDMMLRALHPRTRTRSTSTPTPGQESDEPFDYGDMAFYRQMEEDEIERQRQQAADDARALESQSWNNPNHAESMDDRYWPTDRWDDDVSWLAHRAALGGDISKVLNRINMSTFPRPQPLFVVSQETKEQRRRREMEAERKRRAAAAAASAQLRQQDRQRAINYYNQISGY